jgi:hypothetical protein
MEEAEFEKADIHTFHAIDQFLWTASRLIWLSISPPASFPCPFTAVQQERLYGDSNTSIARFYIRSVKE